MPRLLTDQEIADVWEAYYESIHMKLELSQDELEVLRRVSQATMESE